MTGRAELAGSAPFLMKDISRLYEFRPFGEPTPNREPRAAGVTPTPPSPRSSLREEYEPLGDELTPKHMVAGYVFHRPEAMPRPASRWRSERDSPRTALEAATWQRSGLAKHDPQLISDMLPMLTHTPMHSLPDEAAEVGVADFDELVSAAADDAAEAERELLHSSMGEGNGDAGEETVQMSSSDYVEVAMDDAKLNQPELQMVDRVAGELATEVMSALEDPVLEGAPEATAIRTEPASQSPLARPEAHLERRTRLLTQIFQQKLKEYMVSVRVQSDRVTREHSKTVRALRERYELHLAKAVYKVREVMSANRDAMALITHCQKLEAEKERLRAETMAAIRDLRNEQRERQRMAKYAEGLEAELTSKDEAVEKYRKLLKEEQDRAPPPVDRSGAKAKKDLELMHQEMAGLRKTNSTMEAKIKTTSSALAASREAHEATKRALESERRLRQTIEGKHATAMAQIDAVEVSLVSAKAAMGKVQRFLERMRGDLDMDTSCICCLDELRESTVLVPCGHSVCRECIRRMEAKSSKSALGHDMFCPVCKKNAEEEDSDDDDDILQPSEPFPNTMLDTILSRLRLKSQDISSLLFSLDELTAHMEIQREET